MIVIIITCSIMLYYTTRTPNKHCCIGKYDFFFVTEIIRKLPTLHGSNQKNKIRDYQPREYVLVCEPRLIPAFSPAQVTVKLYKRGSQGWLGKSVSATTTIPSNTFVIFRISGEEADTKIPADTIHTVTLSM